MLDLWRKRQVLLSRRLERDRLLKTYQFGLEPNDSVTIVTASVVLLLVTLPAGYIPARRASRVDPQVALCYE